MRKLKSEEGELSEKNRTVENVIARWQNATNGCG